MEAEVAPGSQPVVSAPAAWTGPGPRFSLGTVLSQTLAIWRSHPVPLLAVALVGEVPTVLVTLMQAGAAGAPVAPRSQLGATVALGFASILATSILTFAALEALAEKPVRLSAIVSTGLRRFGRVLGVSLMTGIMIGLSALALLVPGFMVASSLWVAVPATLAEPDDDRSPIERSRQLTKGHRWTTFLAMVVFLILTYVTYFVLAAGVGFMHATGGAMGLVALALTGTVSAVAGGLYATAPAVAFQQLRALKEGSDTTRLARVFE